MGILSDTSFKELVVPREKSEVAKKWFQKRDWASINGKILILPFDINNLGPFNYDLCVGEEAFAIRTQKRISISKERGAFIEPNDIFLVLTQEYLGLPREFAAYIMPRFCFVREGIIQSMTKIDPTWFGRIAVAITNLSNSSFKLRRGQAFCTLIIQRLDQPSSKVLDPGKVPALGKESIDYFLGSLRKTCIR